MNKTLQDKIDAIDVRHEGYQNILLVNKAIQELREQIQLMIIDFKDLHDYSYPQATAYRSALKDVLALIGEKK